MPRGAYLLSMALAAAIVTVEDGDVVNLGGSPMVRVRGWWRITGIPAFPGPKR